jgi:outer membrane biosynthesis protein TonB
VRACERAQKGELKMEQIIKFLTMVLFNLLGFDVLVWHVAVAVAVLLLLIIIICVCASKSKKKKAQAKAQEQVVEETTTEEPAQEEVAQEVAPAVEEKAETPAETPATEEVEQTPAEEKKGPVKVKVPTKKTVVKKTTNEKPAPKKEEPKKEEKEPATEEKKAQNNVYHITKRKEDDKWQVKLAKGAKAIKLFNTQLEAIEFAKKRVENNEDARIIIHKEDGGFRKLTYKKK